MTFIAQNNFSNIELTSDPSCVQPLSELAYSKVSYQMCIFSLHVVMHIRAHPRPVEDTKHLYLVFSLCHS